MQGLYEGDGLAPILFNIALDNVIREMGIVTRGIMLCRDQQIVSCR